MDNLSRRRFLQLLGAAGGAALMYPVMSGFYVHAQEGDNQPFQLEGSGAGTRVLILGAGIAGLVAAYELSRAGYECQVIEARSRAGGRIWTLRNGEEIVENDYPTQTSQFEDGHFFNAGPDRIPQEHRAVLRYCTEFRIPLRAFVTLNTATYYYNEGVGPLSGQKVRLGQAWTDFQGYTFALLAQLLEGGYLAGRLTEQDRELMIRFLASYGDLGDNLEYTGSTRAGFTTAAGAAQIEGTPVEPLNFSDLLQSNYHTYFPIDWDYHQQLALVHPSNGMDDIVRAFVERLGDIVRYGAEVQEIRRTTEGAQVMFQQDGQSQTIDADYCICTIPLPVLTSIPNDFPPEVQEAIAVVNYLPSTKTGLQFSRRFWEDEDYIYGGGTFTNLSIGQIWYPSHGYHSAKGILTGAFNTGYDAEIYGLMSPQRRVEMTLAQGRKIHTQYDEAFEHGISVAWQNQQYSQGAWAVYTPEQRDTVYPRLLDFDERIYLAGDHMSYLSGWMEGAVRSAQHVVQQIHARVTS